MPATRGEISVISKNGSNREYAHALIGWNARQPEIDRLLRENEELRGERNAAESRFAEWSGTDVPSLNIALNGARQDNATLRERVTELEREIVKHIANAVQLGSERAEAIARETRFSRELAAIRALVVASNECGGCGAENVHADHAGGSGHTRSEHDPSCKGDCQNCPIQISCGPVIYESTLAAVERMAGMVLSDEACERLAGRIAIASGYLFQGPDSFIDAIRQARGTKEARRGEG